MTGYTRHHLMPSRVWLRMAVCVALIGLAAPSPRTQSKRPMTLVDLLTIPRISVDPPQMTLCGRRIVFTLLTTDWPGNRRIPQIWTINADGTGLHRLTSLDGGAADGRWSPDGSTLALVSRGSIFLMPANGGTPRQLSHHATGVADIAWHPDGSSIYFLATDAPTDAERERDRLRGDVTVLDEFRQRHLWRIAVADEKEARITSGDFSIYAFKIAASSKRIIFSRRPTPLTADIDKLELWSVDATGRAG